MGNRLADALSPYLRAHADNPVDWYPWGEEAFAEAARRDIPVLVSIGYATCHWCHVMARESFSDPEVAAILSEGYVAIKVDREEHPDVDASYLAAASAFTRELGWPLTVFTRPDGRAFYAGTYFPPRPVRGVPSFREVLAAVGEAWRDGRDDLDRTADAIGEAIAAASASRTEGELPTSSRLQDAVTELAAQEDPVHGGFGTAPKFPVAPVLAFLARSGTAGRELAARTFLAMAASPLRDPVEGGFFRYATRADWSEPHYERMLTDNALLLSVAADLASEPARSDAVVPVARGLIAFLTGRMRVPSGGFASAQDSESVIDGMRSEGGYYLRDAAGRADLEPPALDAKVLTGWNGLAIGALAHAGQVLADEAAQRTARGAADLLLEQHVRADGTLVRASLDGVASPARATLEDTGMFAGGLVQLATATGEVSYAVAARALIDAAASDDDGVPTGEGQSSPFRAPGGADPVLVARGLAMPEDPAEGATPAGATACADAAWRLYALGAGDRYRELAERAMRAVAGIAVERPIAFGGALELMARMAAPLVQLVTVVPDGERGGGGGADEDPLVHATRGHAASVSTVVTEGEARAFAAAGFELFEGRTARGARPAAYRCHEFVCALPVGTADELAALVTDA
ncbi:uncharacterized protein YyaL (SSP411 family) [Agromyces flavus]|uniref:Uncharacterized protein YyaL (SSP411 family) n=1 Tax=Agromyces flavus TaxID=589382 RepID=A0A1H1ML07_9MICO|nr:DUF255 domain-containing protein [Agromyces flavus]MCP2369244.1 uncharacterized protein YyaL (SSP411 family) [Agromyces flavus]GGI48725.1 thioredoxin domain-containing protein [Agromyces flavus]SDR87493.1 hypothetical protein SAMN04489721_0441 [Agromyces flavus]